jgi:hypothetical protein
MILFRIWFGHWIRRKRLLSQAFCADPIGYTLPRRGIVNVSPVNVSIRQGSARVHQQGRLRSSCQARHVPPSSETLPYLMAVGSGGRSGVGAKVEGNWTVGGSPRSLIKHLRNTRKCGVSPRPNGWVQPRPGLIGIAPAFTSTAALTAHRRLRRRACTAPWRPSRLLARPTSGQVRLDRRAPPHPPAAAATAQGHYQGCPACGTNGAPAQRPLLLGGHVRASGSCQHHDAHDERACLRDISSLLVRYALVHVCTTDTGRSRVRFRALQRVFLRPLQLLSIPRYLWSGPFRRGAG